MNGKSGRQQSDSLTPLASTEDCGLTGNSTRQRMDACGFTIQLMKRGSGNANAGCICAWLATARG